MNQPETGTRHDLIEHRFLIAKEDLDTAYLLLEAKQYIATGIFPREMGRKIIKAEEIRHASDYDTFYVASKEITNQQVETAEQLLNLAKVYYNKKQNVLL